MILKVIICQVIKALLSRSVSKLYVKRFTIYFDFHLKAIVIANCRNLRARILPFTLHKPSQQWRFANIMIANHADSYGLITSWDFSTLMHLNLWPIRKGAY